MLYSSYDTQSSHEGYIDFEIKEILYAPAGEEFNGSLIVSHKGLLELILDDYFVDIEGFDAPSFISDGIYYIDGTMTASRRRIKKFAKKCFDRFGDQECGDVKHEIAWRNQWEMCDNGACGGVKNCFICSDFLVMERAGEYINCM